MRTNFKVRGAASDCTEAYAVPRTRRLRRTTAPIVVRVNSYTEMPRGLALRRALMISRSPRRRI
jgi:hypothetical protein